MLLLKRGLPCSNTLLPKYSANSQRSLKSTMWQPFGPLCSFCYPFLLMSSLSFQTEPQSHCGPQILAAVACSLQFHTISSGQPFLPLSGNFIPASGEQFFSGPLAKSLCLNLGTFTPSLKLAMLPAAFLLLPLLSA